MAKQQALDARRANPENEADLQVRCNETVCVRTPARALRAGGLSAMTQAGAQTGNAAGGLFTKPSMVSSVSGKGG